MCCLVRSLRRADQLVRRSPIDCGASYVIYKPKECGGHSTRWVATPQKKKGTVEETSVGRLGARLGATRIGFKEAAGYSVDGILLVSCRIVRGPHDDCRQLCCHKKQLEIRVIFRLASKSQLRGINNGSSNYEFTHLCHVF